MTQTLISLLGQATPLNKKAITNILTLLEDGATIPFIARYRKELTGGASDDQLRDFYEVYLSGKRLLERKEEIVGILTDREQITDQLRVTIENAQTLTELEDLYRPFKEKKNTRASVAIRNGLESLANILQSGKLSKQEFDSKAKQFVKNSVKNCDEAIKGAQDIIAERFSDSAKERSIVRDMTLRYGSIATKAGKNFDEKGLYKNYKSQNEAVSKIPSHRYLAIKRGEKAKELSVNYRYRSLF